jgi:hypothetical protein
MGNERVTVKNLKVLQVDEANGIVVVSGMYSSLYWMALEDAMGTDRRWSEN